MNNTQNIKNVIYGINGPVVTVKNGVGFFMQEMVLVGTLRLIGEVISVNQDLTTIQVYEDTAGLTPGEPIENTGKPMSVTLGPGLISNIFDGIERPLKDMAEQGAFIKRGGSYNPLNTEKLWDVTILKAVGDEVTAGEIVATTPETPAILHKVMLPYNISGKVSFAVQNGKYAVTDKILEVTDKSGTVHPVFLAQESPIRAPRPFKKRVVSSIPLITGQRVIDSIFMVAKGGTAAIPGGFGTGKTVTQHQIAKWSDADVIIYVGCGERGNEMTQVLDEFGSLVDPKNGRKLTDRTILIANTSNMPVAAREASIYTGITLAEYYRDMGYDTCLMADSTSRFAEALREISGRLEEMPAEEGFPAYLPSRLAEFYERAGRVEALSGELGSVTVIGAVSPQGSDFSEPVTQNTKRFTRVFWALDKSLAYSRHYPAVNWNSSYSEYENELAAYYAKEVNPMFMEYRRKIIKLLLKETDLLEIVKLIGSDVLPEDQKLIIEVAKIIRVGFLQQNSFHSEDTFVPLNKQFKMMEVICLLYDEGLKVVASGRPVSLLFDDGISEKLIKIKYDVPNNNLSLIDKYEEEITKKAKTVLSL